MSLYEFAQGLILEAGNKVRFMMKEELSIETKSNPNDQLRMWIKQLRIIFMMPY